MKTFFAIVALTLLVAASAAAKGAAHPKPITHVEPAHRNNIYESDSLGHQSFPNPDRVLPVPDHYP
jgi:hypothetical protein